MVICYRRFVELAVIKNESYGVAASFKTIACSFLWGNKETNLAIKAKLCEMNESSVSVLSYRIMPLRCVCHSCFPPIKIWDSYPLTEFPRPSSRIRNETRVIRHPCLPTSCSTFTRHADAAMNLPGYRLSYDIL